jgi:hypothetical protein
MLKKTKGPRPDFPEPGKLVEYMDAWKPSFFDEANDSAADEFSIRAIHKNEPPSPCDSGDAQTNTPEFAGSAIDEEGSTEIEGQVRPLIAEGKYVMTCCDHALRATRYKTADGSNELKDYLSWATEDASLLLDQFFPHPKKYTPNCKAVKNYITAMGFKPKRLGRLKLSSLKGLRALVFVETVKPKFTEGALKGTIRHEAHYYSKVSEILEPYGFVDSKTLKELRNKCRNVSLHQ